VQLELGDDSVDVGVSAPGAAAQLSEHEEIRVSSEPQIE
jgi:hypothetical protein